MTTSPLGHGSEVVVTRRGRGWLLAGTRSAAAASWRALVTDSLHRVTLSHGDSSSQHGSRYTGCVTA